MAGGNTELPLFKQYGALECLTGNGETDVYVEVIGKRDRLR